MIVQPADTVIFISRTWMISKYPCRNACATVSTMKRSNRRDIPSNRIKEKVGKQKMKYFSGIVERIGFDFYADIAVRIVAIRNEKGLTQKQLTELLKWPVGKLQSMEAVSRRINAQDLEDLSKALEVSVNYLLEAYNDSPVGDCLYLVWTDSCSDMKVYVKAPNSRMAIFELEKKFKKSGVLMWSNARDRATVRRVGVPLTDRELTDRRGAYREDNLLEKGEEE